MLSSPTIHIGTPPCYKASHPNPNPIETELRTFHFHKFHGLPFEEDIESAVFHCFGHAWKLQIRKTSEGRLGVYLLLPLPMISEHKIRGDFICRIEQTEELDQLAAERFHFDMDWIDEDYDEDDDDENYVSFGQPDIVHVDTITDHGLDHYGTLTVKLEFRLFEDDRITNFQRRDDTLRKNLHNMLSDEDTYDVVFDVRGYITGAHLAILKAMAPDLVRTLNLDEQEKLQPVPIEDVDPDIFRMMLDYIYCSTIVLSETDDAKAMIDAADKYGVDSLKLAAETSYVDCNNLTVDNAAETLLYADGKNCHMLKKAALEYVVKHMKDVVCSSSFSSLHQSESITKEIMLHMAKKARFK